MNANIVKRALGYTKVTRNMYELTQERSRIRVSIVKNALAALQVASDMKQLTQE